MSKIIWLASYPKSGNTWMRAFLHNLLQAPEEGYDINKMTDFTFSDSSIFWYRHFIRKPREEWNDQDVADARWDVQRMLCLQHPDNVFVKTHNALMQYMSRPLIHMDWTAGAIYVVRNPLDVAVSLTHHYGVEIGRAVEIINDTGTGATGNAYAVYEVHNNWNGHVRSWTRHPQPSLHIVRYEDMLEKPRDTFTRVTQFLGLPAPPERIDHAIEMASFKKLREQEEQKGFRERSDKAEKFFREGRSGQWRDVLSPAQIERIVTANREQMERFGYLPA
ncbi:MAG TPA: sulfotransferase domain-containing protein [Dongiaceae bacterium]|jgi:hypothetical protein|nr:sulfotransferase domain-containing protein [Dongiaceae bacterium]